MAILQDQYILDVNQALGQLARVDTEIDRLAVGKNININTAGITRALAEVQKLKAELNTLGGRNTRLVTIRLNADGADRVPRALADVERGVTRVTQAAGMNLGMTQRLSGVFGMIPGPLGLFAAASSTATTALHGLTAAQKLNTLAAFGLAAGLAAILASTAALANHGVKQLGQFQAAVNTLNAQGDGLGDGLDQKMRELQAAGGKSAASFNRAELATAVADLTKQNLKEAEATRLVATSYKLAAAEGNSLVDSSTMLLANLRQFGKDGMEAAEAAEYFGDVLAKGSLQAASGAKELQQGLAVVGPLANKANFSLEETVGLLVAMDNAGLKASTVGANAFRAVLMALASPSGPARKEVENLGVAFENLDGSARPVRDILMDLRKAAAVSGDQYDETTKQQLRMADSVEAAATIFRSRGVVGFLNMTNAADGYIEGLNGAKGALDQYSNALTEGPLKAQERLRKSVDDLALSFAQSFGPKLTAGLDKLTDIFRDLDLLMQNPDTLKTYFSIVVDGFTAVAGAMLLTSDAAKGLLAVTSFQGFVSLLQATVAGQLFVKAAQGLRMIAVATALNKAILEVGTFRALTMALGAIPVAAAAALASIALLAGGVAMYGVKIAADTKAIYDQLEHDSEAQFKSMMDRVNEYRAQGTKLGNLKARQVLVINLRYQYENSDERNAELDKQLLSLKQQIKAEEDAEAARLAAAASKVNDVDLVKQQSEAYVGLIDRLQELKSQFSESGATDFEKSLKSARTELEQFNKEVDKQLEEGKITPAEAKSLQIQREQAQPEITQGLIDRQLEKDGEVRLRHEREIQDALLGISDDAAYKRRVQMERDLADSSRLYQEQIDEAKRNADVAPDDESRKQFNETALRLERQRGEAEKGIRAAALKEIEQVERDHLKKLQSAQREVLSSQTTLASARVALIKNEMAREVELAGENVEAKLAATKRYSGQMAQLESERINIEGQAKRAQARADLEAALEDAKKAGQQTGALELAAREKYNLDMTALDMTQQAERERIQMESDERIRDAEAAVLKERADTYSKSLDKRLAKLDEFTGAQLRAAATDLTGQLNTALVSGDKAMAEVLRSGIEKVTEQAVANAERFSEALKSAADKTADLRTGLSELGFSEEQKAVASATNPYDSIIKGTEEQLAELQKSFASLVAPDSKTIAAYRQQEAELTQIGQQATAERGRAALKAEADFQRARADEAQKGEMERARRELDYGRLSLSGYRALLLADREYWAERLRNAEQGSEDWKAAQSALNANEDELRRLSQEQKTLLKDRAAFSREELESQLDAAKTENERVRLRQALRAHDQAALDFLNSEIANLAEQGGREREILDLKRERLGVQGRLRESQEAEAEAERQLQESVQGRLEAETKLAERLARSDAEVAAARQQGLGNALKRLNSLDAQLLNPKNDIERNNLLSERANLVGEIADLERDISKAPLEVAQQRLEVEQARVALLMRQRGLQDDEVASAQAALLLAQQQAQLARDALAEAQRNGNAAEQRAAQVAVDQADLAVLEKRAALLQAPLEGMQRELALSQALREQEAVRSGLAGGRVAQAAEALTKAREELALAEKRYSLAQGPVQQQQALTELTQKQTAALVAQKGVQEAQLEQLRQRVSLAKAIAQANLKIQGLGDDAVAAARLDLGGIQNDLALNAAALSAAREGSDEYSGLLTEQANLMGQLADAERKLAQAERDRRFVLGELTTAQRELGNVMSGSPTRNDDLTRSLLGVERAYQATAKADEAYQTAMAGGAPEQRLEATRNLTEAIRAQRAAIGEVASAYQKQVDQMDGMREAAERLGKVLYGDKGKPWNDSTELSRYNAIIKRRDEALRQLQTAMQQGDKEAITRALGSLEQQQQRVAEQAKALGDKGIQVFDQQESRLKTLYAQLDRTGIEYDAEAARLAQQRQVEETRMTAAYLFKESADSFASSVQQLLSAPPLQSPQPAPTRLEPVAPAATQPAPALDSAVVGRQLADVFLGAIRMALTAPLPRQGIPTTPAAATPIHNYSYNDHSSISATFNIYEAQDGAAIQRQIESTLNKVRQDAQRQKKFEGGCGKRRS